MDIQSLSVGLSQNRIQEEAAVKVQVMAMQNIESTGADLNRLLESAKSISDPSLGKHLNMFM